MSVRKWLVQVSSLLAELSTGLVNPWVESGRENDELRHEKLTNRQPSFRNTSKGTQIVHLSAK